LEKKEKTLTKDDKSVDNLPSNHFSEKELLEEWNLFLENLQKENVPRYSAIKNCKLQKKTETEILIKIASEAMKEELKSLEDDFLSKFTKKVNNFYIKFSYEEDQTLQKEIVTKRKLFDRFAQKNPVLKDLEDLMKFDFS